MKKKILAGILATAMLAGISTNVMATSVTANVNGAIMNGSNIITSTYGGATTTSTAYADSVRVSMVYAVKNGLKIDKYEASDYNSGTRVDVTRYKTVGESLTVDSTHGLNYKGGSTTKVAPTNKF